jgi:hypothetical protein
MRQNDSEPKSDVHQVLYQDAEYLNIQCSARWGLGHGKEQGTLREPADLPISHDVLFGLDRKAAASLVVVLIDGVGYRRGHLPKRLCFPSQRTKRPNIA